MSNIIVTAVPPEQTGVANGMNTNFRTIGGAIGAAVVVEPDHRQLRPAATRSRRATHGWLLLAGVAAAGRVCSR